MKLMRKWQKELPQKGSITVFLALTLPIILLSSLYILSELAVLHQENQGQKIAYTVSESELSRYNSYYKNQYALLVNYQSNQLEDILREYYQRNDLSAPTSISICYHDLSRPEYFFKAVEDAAQVLIPEELIFQVQQILKKSKGGEHMTQMIEKIEESEKKLADVITIPHHLLKIKSTQSPKKIISLIEQAQNDVNEKHSSYMIQLKEIRKDIGVLDSYLDWKRIKCQSIQEISHGFHQMKHTVQQFTTSLSWICGEKEALETQAQKLETNMDELEEEMKKLLAGESSEPSNSIYSLKELYAQQEHELYHIQNKIQYFDEQAKIKIEHFQRNYTQSKFRVFKQMIKAVYKQLIVSFHPTQPDVVWQEGVDYSVASVNYHPSYLNQLLINEWMIAVFPSLDQNCPRTYRLQGDSKGAVCEKSDTGLELEYIISGKTGAVESIRWIRRRIYGMRLVHNAVSASTDHSLHQALQAVTSTIPSPFNVVAYGLGFSAYVAAESHWDVEHLLMGDGIPVHKKSTDHVIDMDALFSGEVLTIPQDEDPSPVDLYYLDYLRMIMACHDSSQMLLRAMNLTDQRTYIDTGGEAGLSDFNIGHTMTIKWQPAFLFAKKSSVIHLENGYEE